MLRFIIVVGVVVAIAGVDSAPKPFFEAIYDAVNGNGRRSYGYNGYGNNPSYGYGNPSYGYGYNPSEYSPQVGSNGYYNNGYDNYGWRPKRRRQEKSWKDICKVHNPDSIGGLPGASGVICPV